MPRTAARGRAQLPALGAKVDETSVSGISSGAYMAGQFQMAHAKRVIGAAIIAGGPYGCSESIFANTIPGAGTASQSQQSGQRLHARHARQAWGVANPARPRAESQQRAEKGEIDPIADVARDRIYLFTGTSDHTVRPRSSARGEFYDKLGVPKANISSSRTAARRPRLRHRRRRQRMRSSGQPYIVDCDYDQAGELLKQIYGPSAAARQTSTAISSSSTNARLA